MSPTNFPLRWESTGDQWWFASPIDWATANGHYDLVRELLRLDGNHLIKLTSLQRTRRLETVWDDEEQFHDVAKCRSQVARKLLLQCENKKGKNSLIRAGYGGWLLYTAASAGDLCFVQELLEKYPLLVYGEGEYGVTDILYAAAKSKDSDVFRLLFDYASSPRFLSGKSGEYEEHIGEIPAVFKSEMINRAVHAAARGGNLQVLKELLSNCSDVLVYRDAQGSTILHAAASRGQVEVVKDLIASFDIINATDNHGDTVLHVSAFRGQLAVVKSLISASPSSISVRNSTGDTFLHMAVSGFQTHSFRRMDRQIEFMKHLVTFNLQDIVNAKNNDGRTALHLAIVGNIHSDLTQLLMKICSIDVNARDRNGMTPLDLLRQRPHSASSDKLTRQLISAGGIFACQGNNHMARQAIVSRLKMRGYGSSPGTSFRVPDTEIFLYTGIEHTPDDSGDHDHSSGGLITHSSEQNQFDSTTKQDVASSSSKKSGSAKDANLLKRFLPWSKIKEKKPQKTKVSREQSSAISAMKSSNSMATPIPLRQRFSRPSPALPNNKRTLAVRSNLPSPTPRKKFASGIKHGVMNSVPHLAIHRRPSCSFSQSSLCSPCSPEMQNNVFDGIDIEAASSSNQIQDDAPPRGSFNRRYLCFGTPTMSGKGCIGGHEQQNQIQNHRRSVSATA